MKYQVIQTNHFTYEEPVKRNINQFRLKPFDDDHQRCLSFEKKIIPATSCHAYEDYWGNHVEIFYLWDPHDSLIIETTSVVEVYRKGKPDEIAFSFEDLERKGFNQSHAEFLAQTDYTRVNKEKMAEATEDLWVRSSDPFDFVGLLNGYLYENFKYIPGSTTVETTAEEVLEKMEGVCQDYTHLMLGLCRYRGIPSRYVSGYIYSGENSAIRGDAATHAWVEVAFPEIGWIGFDPTNNMLADDQHIKLAVGRDYKDIVPVKGVYIGGSQQLDVKVRVKRVNEEDPLTE
ncbi:MAG TPA: transglutaminase family protein [Bacillales bacterium]|nr:transglutaminase family protein [Bacillales bacterium]